MDTYYDFSVFGKTSFRRTWQILSCLCNQNLDIVLLCLVSTIQYAIGDDHTMYSNEKNFKICIDWELKIWNKVTDGALSFMSDSSIWLRRRQSWVHWTVPSSHSRNVSKTSLQQEVKLQCNIPLTSVSTQLWKMFNIDTGLYGTSKDWRVFYTT
jgi:hypothetical protein